MRMLNSSSTTNILLEFMNPSPLGGWNYFMALLPRLAPPKQLTRQIDSNPHLHYAVAHRMLSYWKLSKNAFGYNCSFAVEIPVSFTANPAVSMKEAQMTMDAVRNKRLIALFLFGYLLFNNPFLSLFNLPKMVWGIPLLFGYMFGVWMILIILIMLIVGSQSS
jgi:hypothetical protein